MKFSELAAQFKSDENTDAGVSSSHALNEIQGSYLFDISGAEGVTTGGTGGSSTPFNAFAQWNMSF